MIYIEDVDVSHSFKTPQTTVVIKMTGVDAYSGGYVDVFGTAHVDAFADMLYNKVANGHKVKRVIFNDPATIVFWGDGTKTVVKATNEKFDREKGLMAAICKKVFGNKGNFNNVIHKWVDQDGRR